MAAAASHGLGLKRPSAIPGFGLALGFTLTYLSLIVLIPLGGLVLKSATLGLAGFWNIVTGERTLAALRLSFETAFIAATVNAAFGVIIAWVLIRYRFPGRRLLDAFVDLPLPCRPQLRASRSPRSMRRTAGSAAGSRRSASRSPTRRSASPSR